MWMPFHAARAGLRQHLAQKLRPEFEKVYLAAGGDAPPSNQPFSVSAEAIGQRALKNRTLGYLVASGDPSAVTRVQRQYDAASNMTDVMARR